MDLPGNPRDVLEADLRNLRAINRYLGGRRSVLFVLKRLLAKSGSRRFTLLDVGTGSGDIPVAITRWARQRGIRATILALEPAAVTAAVAATETRGFPEISVVRGDGFAPPIGERSVDFVLVSQLLHHFSEESIAALLSGWSRLACRAIIVSDLVRHPLAYCAILCLTRCFTRNPMTLNDAPLSVRRAFTRAEWRNLFIRSGFKEIEIFSLFPFRIAALLPLDAAR